MEEKTTEEVPAVVPKTAVVLKTVEDPVLERTAEDPPRMVAATPEMVVRIMVMEVAEVTLETVATLVTVEPKNLN